jgi:pilus assembly protein Flp/PilA
MLDVLNVLKDERGQSLSEYGLLLALVAVVCIAALMFLGDKLVEKFRDVGQQIEQAAPK